MREQLGDMISFWEYNKGNTCFFYGAEQNGNTFRQANA